MLKKVFSSLKKPIGRREDSYDTKVVFKNNHRLGKNYREYPSILFKTKKSDKIINNYLGKNLKLRFNIPCTIHQKKRKIDENLTILTCISKDDQIKKIFLEVCETTFANVPSNPTTTEIKNITESIIDLFKNIPKVRPGILGLWGEFFLIVSSKNIKKCLDAWHKHPEDKYDFYDNNEALEVKCTTKTDRKHEFGHDQLISNLEDHYVASVMTRENFSNGLSVVDLYNKILKEKLDDGLKDKLKKIYYKIVGVTPEEKLEEFKYDYNFAKRNLLYFKVSELSKIENTNPAISNISYTVDLSQNQNVDYLSKDKFTSYLYFPSA